MLNYHYHKFPGQVAAYPYVQWRLCHNLGCYFALCLFGSRGEPSQNVILKKKPLFLEGCEKY